MTNGKGDSPRPLGVSRQEYGARWEDTFREECAWCHITLHSGFFRSWGDLRICPPCLQDAMRTGEVTHNKEGE